MLSIKIKQDEFRRGLDRVCGIVERNQIVGDGEPGSRVYLKAAADQLTLQTSDGDIEIIANSQCEVTSLDSVMVNAGIIQNIVRKLPASSEVTVTHDADGTRLKISVGRLNYSLASINGDKWLESAHVDGGDCVQSATHRASDLKRLLDKVKFAIFPDSSRPYLNGVYLHRCKDDSNRDYLRAVATDGHRLGYAEIETTPFEGDSEIGILSRKSVLELSRLLGDSDNDISMGISTGVVQFSAPDLTFTSRLVAGDFPDYLRIIPTDNTIIAKINRNDLRNAIDRVCLISNTLKFSFSKDRLTLSASDSETGDAVEEMNLEFSDNDLEVGFNGKYVSEIVAQCETDFVEFAFGAPNGPVLISDPEDKGMRFVLMPMRV